MWEGSLQFIAAVERVDNHFVAWL